MAIAVCLIIGFSFWYVLFGIETSLNGGMGGWELPFRSLWEDIRWTFVPGAKTEYFRSSISVGEGCCIGRTQSWDYEEVRANNLYKQAAKDCMPGPIHFFGMHVFLPLIPLILWYGCKEIFF